MALEELGKNNAMTPLNSSHGPLGDHDSQFLRTTGGCSLKFKTGCPFLRHVVAQHSTFQKHDAQPNHHHHPIYVNFLPVIMMFRIVTWGLKPDSFPNFM